MLSSKSLILASFRILQGNSPPTLAPSPEVLSVVLWQKMAIDFFGLASH